MVVDTVAAVHRYISVIEADNTLWADIVEAVAAAVSVVGTEAGFDHLDIPLYQEISDLVGTIAVEERLTKNVHQ